MKARREIADYMKNRRTERARIRVSDLNVFVLELQCLSADRACDPVC